MLEDLVEQQKEYLQNRSSGSNVSDTNSTIDSVSQQIQSGNPKREKDEKAIQHKKLNDLLEDLVEQQKEYLQNRSNGSNVSDTNSTIGSVSQQKVQETNRKQQDNQEWNSDRKAKDTETGPNITSGLGVDNNTGDVGARSNNQFSVNIIPNIKEEQEQGFDHSVSNDSSQTISVKGKKDDLRRNNIDSQEVSTSSTPVEHSEGKREPTDGGVDHKGPNYNGNSDKNSIALNNRVQDYTIPKPVSGNSLQGNASVADAHPNVPENTDEMDKVQRFVERAAIPENLKGYENNEEQRNFIEIRGHTRLNEKLKHRNNEALKSDDEAERALWQETPGGLKRDMGNSEDASASSVQSKQEEENGIKDAEQGLALNTNNIREKEQDAMVTLSNYAETNSANLDNEGEDAPDKARDNTGKVHEENQDDIYEDALDTPFEMRENSRDDQSDHSGMESEDQKHTSTTNSANIHPEDMSEKNDIQELTGTEGQKSVENEIFKDWLQLYGEINIEDGKECNISKSASPQNAKERMQEKVNEIAADLNNNVTLETEEERQDCKVMDDLVETECKMRKSAVKFRKPCENIKRGLKKLKDQGVKCDTDEWAERLNQKNNQSIEGGMGRY